MKKSELRKLVAEYHLLKSKIQKNNYKKIKNLERIKEIEYRYYHETGSKLNE